MRHLPRLLRLVPLALLTSAAGAAEVGPCGELNRIDNLVGQVKSYAEGQIRLAAVETGEPVCCSSHLLVFIPGIDPGGSQCFAVGDERNRDSGPVRGFYSIDPNRFAGTYDPKRGLLITVPFVRYDNAQGKPGKAGSFRVRIDLRGDGSVRVEH